jgi:hypothetical protein
MVSENRGIANGSYFFPYHFNREIRQRLPGREYLVDRCSLEAVEFIERHKDKRRDLLEALHAWQRSVGAAIPDGQRKSI